MVAKKPMITRAWWLNNDNICPICDDLRVAKRQNLRQGFSSWHKLLIECSQEWLHSLYAYRKTTLIRINLKVLFRGFYLILALLFIFCRTSPLPALSCIRSNLFTNPLNGKMQECRQKNVLFFYISKNASVRPRKSNIPQWRSRRYESLSFFVYQYVASACALSIYTLRGQRDSIHIYYINNVRAKKSP